MYKNVNLQIGTVEFSNANIGFMQNFGNKIPKRFTSFKYPQAYWNDRIRTWCKIKVLIIDYKSNRLAITDFLPAEYENLLAEEFESEYGEIKLPLRINGKNM